MFSPRTAAVLALAAATALTLTACSPATGTAVSETSSPSATTATPVDLPDTALGAHASWVLDAMNGEFTAAEIESEAPSRFSEAMLAEVSPAEFGAVFGQLGPQAPWMPTAIDNADTEALITLTPATGDALDLQIVIDTDERISGLLLSPAAADRVPATTWTELESAIESFAADTRMTVTAIENGAPGEVLLDATSAGASASASASASANPTPATGSTTPDPESRPSGSMFKLYVLAAVAEAVTAGTLTWDTPLTITDAVKSLPSGELQNAASGTTVTVREAADLMIRISDNTATDLLIATVGTDAAERALATLGHHDPTENTPFLTTRALFELGWGTPAPDSGSSDSGAGTPASDSATRWAAATGDPDERRQIIAGLPTGLLDIAAEDVSTPVWQNGLDWFTTPADLTAAHLALQKIAATPAGAPVRDILAQNNGLGDVFADWSYVAFKGGSSVGVLAGSWYLEHPDGRAYVLTIQGSSLDPTTLADTRTFFAQIQDAVTLLASE